MRVLVYQNKKKLEKIAETKPLNKLTIEEYMPTIYDEFEALDLETQLTVLGYGGKLAVKKLIREKGYEFGNAGITIAAERPKLNPHIEDMKKCLAQVMGVDVDDVSIKATTTEKLGFTGRQEGISAYATVLIKKI